MTSSNVFFEADLNNNETLKEKRRVESACHQAWKTKFDIDGEADGEPDDAAAALNVAMLCTRLWLSGHQRLELDTKKLRQNIRNVLMKPLGDDHISFEASRAWVVYWLLHALEMVQTVDEVIPPGTKSPLLPIDEDIAIRVINFAKAAQSPDGGFGGGAGQIPHVATTYAVVASLAIIGTDAALSLVDRPKLYRFLMAMRSVDSKGRFVGFTVHAGGETDVRAAYCAAATASMMRLVTDELTAGVIDYITSLQQWDGGIGSHACGESHGGLAYCALATLGIIGGIDRLDTRSLLDWLVHRQVDNLGGFNGRPNKVVDSCYSFWVGGSLAILKECVFYDGESSSSSSSCSGGDAKGDEWRSAAPFHCPAAVMVYILGCCYGTVGPTEATVEDLDDVALPGGGSQDSSSSCTTYEEEDTSWMIRDKPSKPGDPYHTCYGMSGLTVAQRALEQSGDLVGKNVVLPDVYPSDVFYNIRPDKTENLRSYFTHDKVFMPPRSSSPANEGLGLITTHRRRRQKEVEEESLQQQRTSSGAASIHDDLDACGG